MSGTIRHNGDNSNSAIRHAEISLSRRRAEFDRRESRRFDDAALKNRRNSR